MRGDVTKEIFPMC